jgi:HAD superfamily hydrolase (TIGR01509 family)
MHVVDGAHFDWSGIDTVLLDMDGTLLDLRFDNLFWQEVVPRRYGELHGIELEEARRRLEPRFAARAGTLEWYCLDHWSAELGIDIALLKAEVEDHIDFLPDVPEFLDAVRAAGKRLILVTNAHRASLAVKLRRTRLDRYLDAIHSSHDIGLPKEEPRFWAALRAREPFDWMRTVLVDDSLPVLRAAHAAGIGRVIAVRRPDSTRPPRQVDDFQAVDGLPELGAPRREEGD